MPISKLSKFGYTGESEFTFVFEDEDYTLGGLLQSIISSYPDVEYVGYNVPHPSERKMLIRIQVKKGRALDALERGLQDMVNLCDHTLSTFNDELAEYKKSNKAKESSEETNKRRVAEALADYMSEDEEIWDTY